MKLEVEVMNLKFPWMRTELIESLEELGDPMQQEKEWLPGAGALDRIIHFLFDDTPLPQNALGYYLRSVEEVEAVGEVQQALDDLLTVHGNDLSDHEYIRQTEWPRVVEGARKALRLLNAPEVTR